MLNLLACRQGKQADEARINTDLPIASDWDGIRLGVDEQAQIPTRCPSDDATALDGSLWKFLGMETNQTQAGDTDLVALGRTQRIGEGDGVKLVPQTLEARLLPQLLEAPFPGNMGSKQNALKGVAGDTQPFPMTGQQVLEVFGGMIDMVPGVQLDLAHSEIPHPSQVV